MSRTIERTIRYWPTGRHIWEWEVVTWRGTTWLTRTTGLAESAIDAYAAASAYHSQYPLRSGEEV